MQEIKINCKVKLLEDIESDFSDNIIPAGTIGVIVEIYKNPFSYAVDLAIPAEDLVGGFRYENVVLESSQFSVIE